MDDTNGLAAALAFDFALFFFKNVDRVREPSCDTCATLRAREAQKNSAARVFHPLVTWTTDSDSGQSRTFLPSSTGAGSWDPAAVDPPL